MPPVLSRQRGVFPLPSGYFCENVLDRSSHLCRAVRRRLVRNNKPCEWKNDAIEALNSLSGISESEIAADHSLGLGTKTALSNIDIAINGLGSPPPGLTSEGALAELLRSSSVYSDSRIDVAPYAKDRVSWPPIGSTPCALVAGLSEADSSWLSDWRAHMLKSNDVCTGTTTSHHDSMPFKPHSDRSLFSSPKVYGDFLDRLSAAGMINWNTPEAGEDGVLGVFFVTKKDGSLRIIFDTRKLNESFKDPPSTNLPSAAAFSSVEAPDGAEVFMGSADVKNAFYVLETPPELSRMFTLPKIKRKHVKQCSSVPDGNLDDYLIPSLRVLPMGWSWSLHLCQMFVSSQVHSVVPSSQQIIDKAPGRTLQNKDSVLCATYVDNF